MGKVAIHPDRYFDLPTRDNPRRYPDTGHVDDNGWFVSHWAKGDPVRCKNGLAINGLPNMEEMIMICETHGYSPQQRRNTLTLKVKNPALHDELMSRRLQVYSDYLHYREEGEVPKTANHNDEVLRLAQAACVAGMPERDLYCYDLSTSKGRAELRATIKMLESGEMSAEELEQKQLTTLKNRVNVEQSEQDRSEETMLAVDKYTGEVLENNRDEFEDRPLVAREKKAFKSNVVRQLASEDEEENTEATPKRTKVQPKETPVMNVAQSFSVPTALDNASPSVSANVAKVLEQVKDFGQIISLPILELTADGKYRVLKQQAVVDAIAYFAKCRPMFYRSHPIHAWVKVSEGNMVMMAISLQEINILAAKSPEETQEAVAYRAAKVAPVYVYEVATPIVEVPEEVAEEEPKEPQTKEVPATEVVEASKETITEAMLSDIAIALNGNIMTLKSKVNAAHKTLGKRTLEKSDTKATVLLAANELLKAFGVSVTEQPTAEVKEDKKEKAPAAPRATMKSDEIKKLAKERNVNVSNVNWKSSTERAKAQAAVEAAA
jgi:hypothetical protein